MPTYTTDPRHIGHPWIAIYIGLPRCHQRIFCHSPVTMGCMWGGNAGNGVPHGVPHFLQSDAVVIFGIVLVPGLRHFLLGCFLLSRNTARQALTIQIDAIRAAAPCSRLAAVPGKTSTGLIEVIFVLQFIAQFADKIKWRVGILMKGRYFSIIKS